MSKIDQNMARAALAMYARDHGIHFGDSVSWIH